MKRTYLTILVLASVLLADQALKFWVKTGMSLGQEFSVIGDWFKLHFIENEGMAFGLSYGGSLGKLLLTLFRLAAVLLISVYLYRIVASKARYGLIIGISLILAGALGNITDSVFYGMLFEASTYHGKVAAFLPEKGYAGIFHGKVVDMFYFPLIEGYYPDWFPIWGGKPFIFFRPVFNLADSAITIGVLMILIFHRGHFMSNRDAERRMKRHRTIKVEAKEKRRPRIPGKMTLIEIGEYARNELDRIKKGLGREDETAGDEQPEAGGGMAEGESGEADSAGVSGNDSAQPR